MCRPAPRTAHNRAEVRDIKLPYLRPILDAWARVNKVTDRRKTRRNTAGIEGKHMSLLSSSMDILTTRLKPFLDISARAPRRSTAKVLSTGSMLREVGLLSGTMVATDTGWCPIERVLADDQIMTFDNGMQTVVQNRAMVIRRKDIPDHKAFSMFVPRGVLGNRTDLNLLPMQEVILESDAAETMFGNAFVLTPAALLEGYQGITRHPIMTDIKLHMLTFKEEQIVQTDGEILVLAQSERCFSPFAETVGADRNVYPRLTQAQVLELINAENGH